MSELRRLRQVEEENARLGASWPISPSTSTCCRGARKKSEARPSSGTGPVVSWDVSGELCAGLSLSTVWSSLVVSTQPRERSVRRFGCAFVIWLMRGLGLATCGFGSCCDVRVAHQSQARSPLVSARWAPAADASATTEAYRVAPRPGSGPGGPDRALEHGFCPLIPWSTGDRFGYLTVVDNWSRHESPTEAGFG